MGRKDSIPNDAPAPRLCCLVKWKHFQGYGFNLHSEKGKEGQFIGKIDAASPAEACGLREGDEVIEVNGVNTSNENHKQVVQRIKAIPDKVDLLVVDAETAEYYKKRHIVVKGSQWNVKKMTSKRSSDDHDHETGEKSSQGHTSVDESLAFAAQSNGDDHSPPPVPPKTDLSLETADQSENSATAQHVPESSSRTGETEKSESENAAETADEDLPPPPPSLLADNVEDSTDAPREEEAAAAATSEASASPVKSEDGDSAQKLEKVETPRIDTSLRVESGSDRAQPSPAPSLGSTGTVESAKSGESVKSGEEDKFGLKLNMTAAEMKEYLKSKKRHDPRNDSMSFKQRHAIVSNM